MDNSKPDLFYQEMEIIEKRIMLNKLIQLNLSLYNAILEYAKCNGVSLKFDATLLRLAKEIEETDIETFPKNQPSDGFSQRKPSDTDFTEPKL
jgi:hypothetical protein